MQCMLGYLFAPTEYRFPSILDPRTHLTGIETQALFSAGSERAGGAPKCIGSAIGTAAPRVALALGTPII